MVGRGILGYGAYLPFRRLDRAEIAAVAGLGGGKGMRTVASYDEDTTTLAVEACRNSGSRSDVASLWFSTTTPAYVDKTNAAAIHAALGMDATVPAFDVHGAVRSAMGALRAGLSSGSPALVVAADMRTGLPGSPDEAAGGDGAAAFVVGEATGEAPLIAEVIGSASITDEFLDRWRTPGASASKLWEERFGEGRYLSVGGHAWDDALKAAGLGVDDVDHVVIVGSNVRAASSLARKVGVADKAVPGLEIGFTGAAQPALALAAALDQAEAGRVVALVVLADGADVLLLRTTEELATRRPARTVDDQVAAGGKVSYGRYLTWRGFLQVEPPRRPEPARPSAAAAGRSTEWKFALMHDGRSLADRQGTIATFTIDRMAYSPSPPVVFAVVDFDEGERLPVELTDVDPDEVRIGDRVEMTFRKLFTADGIHNYFWKARPVRSGGGG